jgi:putative membrane-bound dehydrogenase-like protein
MRLSLLGVLLATSQLFAQGFTPEDALKRMQLPPGFSAKAVATEPMIRQPLSISFDERGRMWVLQYLQYPNPAGLKPLKQDQYLRTVWDRVPEPPPKGPKGLDRITILSGPDENGRYTKSKDFVSGLNLATGFCIGNGGVYVVQPPYLLFYPDKDHDDVPDGDPEVCLTGFGMEDTHSYANSLQWGPDGWLYGAHGSTVTAKIKNPDWIANRPSSRAPEYIEFQQGIWRYHPKTKRFELFAEGGGNTYGLDFDKYGRCIAGTNWGGFAMLHHVQGAYYVKGFSKHGPLHNPHTYGYFEHVPYENFKGGHVTCGGIVYQADTYPKEFHDQYIAGNLLSNAIYWHIMTPKGSSFTAKHGGDLLVSNDTWFRPVDCFLGPDGSVYIADWYDKRAAHLDPIDNWDKTNGRVYRIEYQGTKQPAPFDLRKKTSVELVELLKHPNKWWRNEAQRLLAERQDKSVLAALTDQLANGRGVPVLEALWVLYALDGLTDEMALKLLDHPEEHVRAWVVRLLGDRPRTKWEFPNYSPLGADVPESLVAKLVHLAETDSSVTVRSQLACTAKRLDRTPGMRLASALAARSDDADDPLMPLLIWWAMEPHFNMPPLALQRIALPTTPKMRDFLAERMARRTVAADLVQADSPDRRINPDPPEERRNRLTYTPGLLSDATAPAVPAVLRGVEAALDGRAFDRLLPGTAAWLDHLQGHRPEDENLFRIRVRFNHGDALKEAHARLADPKRPDGDKIKVILLLGQVRRPESLPVLVSLFRESKSEAIRGAALAAAQSFGDSKVADELVETFPKLTGNLRQQVLGILLSRPITTLTVLHDVDSKKLDPKSIPTEQLRPVLEFKNEEIDKLVLKHWGKIGAATPGEKMARIRWLAAELNTGNRNAIAGKELFTKHCAACHTLFGEGGKVGPDLTTADRKNRDYLLTHIVDPSLYIRPEFMAYNVTTLDNRRLTGLVGESTEASVTLLNVIENKPIKIVVAKKDIDEMLPSAVSLMPEKLLDTLSYQEIRDLFAYLQTPDPKDKQQTPAKPQPQLSQNGARPAETKEVKKLRVLLISGSVEYKSDESLAALQKHLEANYAVECSRAFRKTDEDLPGLEGLETCDVAVFFTRRLKIDGEQLDRVKKYATSGKPIVAIRTASHGFQNWLDMDKEVLGGDYKSHYGHDLKTELKLTEAGNKHPVLTGVKPFSATGGLYKNPAVAKDVTVLMMGSIPDHTEPVTWVREHKGGRVFYTSLGHPDDFKDANFVRMLTNAVFWTTKKEVPK